MKRKVDWFHVAVILAATALVVWVSVMLGKSPIGYAFGGEAELTWTAPTQRCDGSPLTNLTGYSLTYGQKREALGTQPLSYTVRGLTPGVWWFSLAAVDSTGLRSEFVTVEKTVTPEEFVTTSADVYTFVKAADRVILLKVGTVPIGVRCDATTSVNGKYAVPVARVTWSGSTRPVVVVGDCG